MRLCEVSCKSTPAPRSRVVLAARQSDRPGRGGGGGGSGAGPPQSFSPPERLLSTGGAEAPLRETVYTLRLSTSLTRGATLTDPTAAVLVCLVGGDGSALLHRVPRITDPELAEQEVRDICASIDDKEAGADCSLALHAAASQRQSGASAPPRLRFQQGSVDEVSFSAPELGPLAALMVGPEQGRWLCEEVDVSSSRTGHTDRFVCRSALGEGGQPAAYLQPMPPGCVMYGSGDSAVVVTKERAAQLYSLNMQQYAEMKGQLIAATAVLVGLGSALAYAVGGRDLALPFALGGTSGMLYQYMLQVAADGVGGGGSSAYSQERAALVASSLSLGRLLANPVARLAVAVVLLGGVFSTLQLTGGSSLEQTSPTASMFQVQQIAATLVGFLCYKAAVVGVAIMPPPPGEQQSDMQQARPGGSGSQGGGGTNPRSL
ncbi:hypothetical protein ACK3TF_003579 [Chlorella vulgaris]